MKTYDLIRDNKTRWNSSDAMIVRGFDLRNSIDSLIDAEILEYNKKYDAYENRLKAWEENMSRKKGKKPKPPNRPSVCDDKLSNDEWKTLTIYHEMLQPFKEATKLLEGRPMKG